MDKSKKERTRDRIIDAALDEFVAAGIMESSFERVASRADVARRTIYNHFSDRNDLLCAVIDSRLEKGIDEVRSLRKSCCGIDALADFCLIFWLDDPRLIKLMRRLQEEKVGRFSDLHGSFIEELRNLFIELSLRSSLRFRNPDANLRLVFVSLFPMLEIISEEKDFKSNFRDIFSKTLLG